MQRACVIGLRREGKGRAGTGDWTGSVIERSQAQHSKLMTYECPELFLTVIFETLRMLRFRWCYSSVWVDRTSQPCAKRKISGVVSALSSQNWRCVGPITLSSDKKFLTKKSQTMINRSRNLRMSCHFNTARCCQTSLIESLQVLLHLRWEVAVCSPMDRSQICSEIHYWSNKVDFLEVRFHWVQSGGRPLASFGHFRRHKKSTSGKSVSKATTRHPAVNIFQPEVQRASLHYLFLQSNPSGRTPLRDSKPDR